jgi:hypothetical protein
MKKLLALALALSLASCTSVGQALSSLGGSVASVTTTAPPSQAKTVAEAIQATQLVEDGLDLYITNGHPSKAILDELAVLIPALHNTLVKAEDAQRGGSSAAVATALAAFNEALGAVKAYEVAKGVSQ